MKFIIAIIVIAVSTNTTVCSQNFGGHETFLRSVDANSARQQLDSKVYFSTQRPSKKSQPFQVAINSHQNVTSYSVQRLSSLNTSPNISYPSFTTYSTLRPISQESSSTYISQGFRSSTSYNPRINQLLYSKADLSTFLPLNSSKSWSTPSPLQPPLFSLNSSRSLRSNSKRRSLVDTSGKATDVQSVGNTTGPDVIPPTPPPTPETVTVDSYSRRTTVRLQENTYLPPPTTKQQPKQRSFQAATNSQQNGVTSYRVQRPSSLYTPPNIGYPASGQSFSTPFSTPRPNNLQSSSTYVPQGFRGSTSYNPRPSQPSYSNTGSSAFPPLNTPKESPTYLQPPLLSSTSPRPFLPDSMIDTPLSSAAGTGIDTGIGLPEDTPNKPPSIPLASRPSGPSRPSGSPPTRGYPSLGYPSSSRGSTSTGGYTSSERPFPPFTIPGEIGVDTGSNVITAGKGPETKTNVPTTVTGDTFFSAGTSQVDEDLNHPPHIHSLDVECSKTMMTIDIEFNRVFDGIIYSKGFYANPECRYVKQNSGLMSYRFTLYLDSCGTQFINDFDGAAGQAYLENVLVLQNETGIQEVWDTVRRVRCLWEGNIHKALTVHLSIDMLNQEIVTFSGDTATAKLDIQIGKGPFAPAANRLVKIGETMTLVVSVEGDPGFDLQVRDCLARDETSTNMLQLTDKRGCILKPKLFGAFQKTKDAGNTGASIIAYAFFRAFKFPDIMDLIIECNVELCKTNCEPCSEANQHIDPRRRRSVIYAPSTNNSINSILLSDPVRIRWRFKVIMLDDLSAASSHILNNMEESVVETMTETRKICISNSRFYTTFFLMLSTFFIATISVVVLYIKLQRIQKPKFVDS